MGWLFFFFASGLPRFTAGTGRRGERMFLKFIIGGDRLRTAAGLFLTRLLRESAPWGHGSRLSRPAASAVPRARGRRRRARRRPPPRRAPIPLRTAARPCGALCRCGGEPAPRARLPLTARPGPAPACALAWCFPPSWGSSAVGSPPLSAPPPSAHGRRAGNC